jgi:hypothetical protein
MKPARFFETPLEAFILHICKVYNRKEEPMKKITVVMGMISAMLVIMVFPSYGQVINGCYQKNNGQLRILAGPGDACRPSEVAIQWNQKGDKGDKGDQGDTGATGADGAQGPPGVPNGTTIAAYGQVTDNGDVLSGSDNWSCTYKDLPQDPPRVRKFYVLLETLTDATHPPTCVVSADYDTYDQIYYMPFNVTQFKHSPVYDNYYKCWALEIGAATANYQQPPRKVPSTTGFSFVCVQ